MIKNYFYTLFIGIVLCFLTISCEQDSYEEAELKPKTYSFTIPNKISFNFSQLSENRESIAPYSNTLVLKNISNTNFSGKYAVFAFKDMSQNYGNIAFIKYSNFNTINTGISSDSITLETSDNLFADENLIATIINFNDSTSDHNLNGFYTGELNVLIPALDETSEPTFVKSVICTGFIDYQGKFKLYTQDEDEQNIVKIEGNFNSENLISGSIFNRENATLSSLNNIEDETFQLITNSFTGSLMYINNTEARLLTFNLTKQN